MDMRRQGGGSVNIMISRGQIRAQERPGQSLNSVRAIRHQCIDYGQCGGVDLRVGRKTVVLLCMTEARSEI